jgi:hypothetical protein
MDNSINYDKYNKIKSKIKNIEILSKEDIKYMNTLPKIYLIELLNIYNENYKYLLNFIKNSCYNI